MEIPSLGIAGIVVILPAYSPFLVNEGLVQILLGILRVITPLNSTYMKSPRASLTDGTASGDSSDWNFGIIPAPTSYVI
jgi:hypothetical protein